MAFSVSVIDALRSCSSSFIAPLLALARSSCLRASSFHLAASAAMSVASGFVVVSVLACVVSVVSVDVCPVSVLASSVD